MGGSGPESRLYTTSFLRRGKWAAFAIVMVMLLGPCCYLGAAGVAQRWVIVCVLSCWTPIVAWEVVKWRYVRQLRRRLRPASSKAA